ncbi:Protein of unknown function [Bacillus wiedmannii]|nr:Protein of unknown function [Bacillus wiedmannii]
MGILAIFFKTYF